MLFDNMSSLHFDKKGVPVTLIGLDNAGKTSLALRLRKGEWIEETSPTIGVNFEMYRIGDIQFKIFDVGGHEAFRRQFWLNFASFSYGILYVFDSSDRKRIEEGKQVFWQLIENLEIESRIVIAFLANKSDLESMELDEIIKELELQKISKYPKISFQIFKISVKTAQNIDNAIEWFSKKIKDLSKGQSITPKGLLISSSLGNIKLFLDFTNVTDNVDTIIEMLLVAGAKQKTIQTEKVASILSNYAKIVYQERNEIIISIIVEQNDSQIEAQRFIELIFEHLETKKTSSKEELIDFIAKTLEIPEGELRTVREIDI